MSLRGIRVGVTAHRKGTELAAALERRGAHVVHGPTLGGDVPVPEGEIVADTDVILAAAPHWVVASTGVGMRLWADAADRHGRGDGLRATAAAARCVARGPKAAGGLHALQVKPVWSSPRQTDADVAGWLAARVLPGDVVAVQLHGTAAPTTFDEVAAAGADVLSVATYRHSFPDELDPAHRLITAIVERRLDVVTFTSPGAARNLVAIAAQQDPDTGRALVEALRDDVATCVIGPVTSSALEELGIPAWLAPQRWRTGDLLRALESWTLRRTDPGASAPGLRLDPAAHAVETPAGGRIHLGIRGYAVLATLARRAGTVCASEQLLLEAWGHAAPQDPSAIKHQISRLRRKLAGSGLEIRTVRGVGYRLDRTSP